MSLFEDFYMDVASIAVAHEFTLDVPHRCEYPNGRGLYGLVYAIEGEAEYRFATGDRCALRRGELMLLSRHAAYAIAVKERFRHYTVNFELHEEASVLSPLAGTYVRITPHDSDRYARCLGQLVAAWRARQAGHMLSCTARLYELLTYIHHDLTADPQERAMHARLRPAREHIERCFREDITLEALARLCCMSPTHFRREWARLYRQPPMQYRDELRLAYAKEHLLSGYYTVTEVAAACGFEDASYFVRFFKKHTGITPGAFKRQAPIL